MLQFQQHLFRTFFFPQMTSCAIHYDVIYHPFPINFQYLKTCGVDSPEFVLGKTSTQPIHLFSIHILMHFLFKLTLCEEIVRDCLNGFMRNSYPLDAEVST